MAMPPLRLVLVGMGLILTGLLYNAEAENRRSLCIRPLTLKYMTCEAGNLIFPVKALTFRSRQLSSATACCSSWERRSDCSARGTVHIEEHDHTILFRHGSLGECEDLKNCTPRVPVSVGTLPTGVEYICINITNIIGFEERAYSTSDAVVPIFRSTLSSKDQHWNCLVETPDCSAGLADVFLGMSYNRSDLESCSSLKVKDKPWLECAERSHTQTYRGITTPFSVALRVDKDDENSVAMAVIYAQDDKSLHVSCGRDGETSVSACSAGSGALPGIVSSVVLAVVVVVVVVGVAVLRFKYRSTPAPSIPKRREDNSGYSELSYMGVFRSRTQGGHETRRQGHGVSSGADNAGYTDPYYLTTTAGKDPHYVSIIE